MPYYFSAYEIAELAAGVEAEGYRFYVFLEKHSADDRARAVFRVLAEQEHAHLAAFRGMADAARKESPELEYSIDLKGALEASLYGLKQSAFHIGRPAQKLDVRAALDIAIHTEQEAVRIYSAIRDGLISRFQEALTGIINEEAKHLELLSGLKKRLPERD